MKNGIYLTLNESALLKIESCTFDFSDDSLIEWFVHKLSTSFGHTQYSPLYYYWPGRELAKGFDPWSICKYKIWAIMWLQYCVTLSNFQALSVEIKEKQKLYKIVEEEIHAYCQLYFAVIEHSARLYFCLTNLININYMYQFSLDWFLKTYVTSIDTA